MADLTYREINQEVLQSLSPPSRGYWGLLADCFVGVVWGGLCWFYQTQLGMGVTG